MRGCRPLTDEEAERVLGHFSGRDAARNRAIFVLGVLAGFRISELLSLRVRDVLHRKEIALRIAVPRRRMKGRREGRSVLLHPQAKFALTTWLEELRQRGNLGRDSYVFPSRKGPNRPLGRIQAWRVLRRAFREARLTGSLGTHSLRKTFADRIYERLGNDLVLTQRALGHRDPASTVAYLSFREEEIDAAILAL